MKRVILTRSGLLWILLLFAALFFISQSVDRGNAQRGPAVTETEVPSAQLFYVTRTPPCQWELNGLVAASDFVRLVFRRQEAWRDVSSAPRALVFGREYQDRHFDLLTASDLLKIELRPEGPKQWSAPTSLVMMPNYNYLLPRSGQEHDGPSETSGNSNSFQEFPLLRATPIRPGLRAESSNFRDRKAPGGVRYSSPRFQFFSHVGPDRD